MLAQYYPDEKMIFIYPDRKSTNIMEIPKQDRKKFGFPPFREWERTSWGYEIEFHFEVNQEMKGGE